MEQEDADNEFIGALVGAYRDELPQCELCGTTYDARIPYTTLEATCRGQPGQPCCAKTLLPPAPPTSTRDVKRIEWGLTGEAAQITLSAMDATQLASAGLAGEYAVSADRPAGSSLLEHGGIYAVQWRRADDAAAMTNEWIWANRCGPARPCATSQDSHDLAQSRAAGT